MQVSSESWLRLLSSFTWTVAAGAVSMETEGNAGVG